eukprot:305553_1
MSASQKSFILFMVLWLMALYSKILYVSQNGTDSPHCGQSLDTACGTLYTATANAHFFYNYTRSFYNYSSSNSSEIFIHDGQNKDEINKYFISNTTKIWHPCLPYPNGTILSITFNNQYIHKMNDWFMKGVCYDNNHHTIKYLNTYLFDT